MDVASYEADKNYCWRF